MAMYSLRVSILSRKKGNNVVKRACYVLGEKFNDIRTGLNYSYRNREDVLNIGYCFDKSNVINQGSFNDNIQYFLDNINNSEVKSNARTARQIVCNVPFELSPEQRLELVNNFCKKLVNDYKIGCVFGIHKPDVASGGDPRNYHAHILLSTRPFENNKFGKKLRNWDKQQGGKKVILKIRKDYEILLNQALEAFGLTERVSCESLAKQGIKRAPTKHVGVKATNLERRMNKGLDFTQPGVVPFKSNKRKLLDAEKHLEDKRIIENEIVNLEKYLQQLEDEKVYLYEEENVENLKNQNSILQNENKFLDKIRNKNNNIKNYISKQFTNIIRFDNSKTDIVPADFQLKNNLISKIENKKVLEYFNKFNDKKKQPKPTGDREPF